MNRIRQDVLESFAKYEGGLSESPFHRATTAIALFDFLDRLKIAGFPKDWPVRLQDLLSSLRTIASEYERSFEFSKQDFTQFDGDYQHADVQAATGEVYFALWKNFSREEYFAQATELLRVRFERNGIDAKALGRVLDDGCGGGRYSMALRALGAREVVGIDVSPGSVAFARKMSPFDPNEVSFVEGSVLELPFPDASFDCVFSNGVLHHTHSTERGLAEIQRVLKPGGRCWLYLYGGKDSLFWDIVDFSRRLLAKVPQAYTQFLMKAMGYPPGRVFHRNDFFYVPMNRRYLATEVESMLKATGLNTFRRLRRGAEHDWDELRHQNPSLDPYIYGEGEMRYWIEKA